MPCSHRLEKALTEPGLSAFSHTFFRPCAFFVLFSLAVNAAALESAFRAARSVHLSYPAPAATAFYNEVIVDKTVNGSYFMACGWDTGYFGIQQLDSPDEKVVLFSVWDPTTGDDPNAVHTKDRTKVLFTGEGVRIKRFGGEGTGAQCMWHHSWQPGQTNRFLISAAPEDQNTAYTAWFMVEGRWKKLASFQTRTGGHLLNGLYSFIEDFRRDTKSVTEERRARFGNAWIKTDQTNWTPLTSARFTASNAQWESKDNIDCGSERVWFFLATGGDIKSSHELKSLISLPQPQAPTPSKPPTTLPPEL